MVDTPRSLDDILDLLADGGPVSAQDLRDAIVSIASPVVGGGFDPGVLDVTKDPYAADNTGAVSIDTPVADAVDALPASGGRLYAPPGEYKTDAGLSTGTSPVALAGAGQRATIIRGTAAALVSLKTRDRLRELSITDSADLNDADTIAVQVGSATPSVATIAWALDQVEAVGRDVGNTWDASLLGVGVLLLSALEGSMHNCVVTLWDTGIKTAVNEVGNGSNAVLLSGGRYAQNNIAIDIPSGTCNDMFLHSVTLEGNSIGLRCADATAQIQMTNSHLENTLGAGLGVLLLAGHLISVGNAYGNTTTDIETSGSGRFTLVNDVVSGDIIHNGTGLGRIDGATEVYGSITGTGPIWRDFDVAVAPTYGPSITIDPRRGRTFTVTITDATAFTLTNPDMPSVVELHGLTIRIILVNASGVGSGAVSFGSLYRASGGASLAADRARIMDFTYNATYDRLIETSRSADIAL